MIVTLVSNPFNGTPATLMTFKSDATGTTPYYKLKELQGWYGGGYRQGVDDREGAMGGIGPQSLYRPMKVMAIEAFIYGGSDADTAATYSAISALPGTSMEMKVSGDGSGNDTRMIVYINGPIEIVPITARTGHVLIPIVAPDPRKWSQTETSLTLNVGSGTNTISAAFTNLGTAPADVRARLNIISGSLPATRQPVVFSGTGGITGTNGGISYGSASGSSSSTDVWFYPDVGGIAIDSSGETAPLNLELGGTWHNRWLSVAPGATTTLVITCGSTGTANADATVYFRSAWW